MTHSVKPTLERLENRCAPTSVALAAPGERAPSQVGYSDSGMEPLPGDFWRSYGNGMATDSPSIQLVYLPSSETKADDLPLHTNTQFSEPVVAFGSPRSTEALDALFAQVAARRAAKPASPPQANNVPNNAALAGVGASAVGGASTPNVVSGGGNGVSAGGGAGGGANWNQLLGNQVNVASNAVATMPVTPSVATASTAPATPAAGTSTPTAGGMNPSVSGSAGTISRDTSSRSISPSVNLLPSDSVQQIYDTAGTYTWTVPDGVTSVNVQLWGGGGGGGAGSSYTGTMGGLTGGGGGGGTYVYVGSLSVTPGSDYTVVVGAGGAGGYIGGSVGGSGGNGGDSYFGDDTNLAQGGTGGGGGLVGGYGGGGVNDGGAGGNGGFGPTAGGGGGGGAGAASDAGGNGGDASDATGGAGGSADMGSGAGGNGGDASSPGSDGQAPGGGGGGGGVEDGVGQAGGDGGDGEVFIAWVAASNDDVLVWNPSDGSTDASLASNWFDQTWNNGEGKQGVEEPGPNTIVVFDGTPNSETSKNAPITWTDGVTVASMTIQNGYNVLQTINPGIEVELAGASGLSLSMDGNSWLKLDLLDLDSAFQIDAFATITNMDLSGNIDAQFIITGGTTTMAQAPGFTEKLGVQFDIESGALVSYKSNNSLQLTDDGVTITVRGKMYLNFGPLATNTLIDGGAANPSDYINVNGGFLRYYGRANITDTITVPIIVQNGGKFLVSANPTASKPLAGTLIVQGANASTQNVSVYLTGSSSLVQLARYDTLECDSDYFQDSGILETMDNSTCTLEVDAEAIIDGGAVWIDTKPASYGVLNVNGDMDLGGALWGAIQGYALTGQKGNSDVLNVTGNLSLDPDTSSLYVNDYFSPKLQKGANNTDFWIVITSTNNIQGDFASESDYIKANLTYGPPNNPELNKYRITFNG